MHTRQLSSLLAALVIVLAPMCSPEAPEAPSQEKADDTATGQDNPDTPNVPNTPDTPDTPAVPDTPETPDNPENPEVPDTPVTTEQILVLVDEGEKPDGVRPTPQHPDDSHSVEYTDFYNAVQDELDEYGNVDYVISQGDGTAWPIITNEGWIRLYQGGSKGGSYIRVRSRNGARLTAVTIGSATASKVAHTLNRKAAKSATSDIEAGGRYTVDGLQNCQEVCFYCMGTTQNERLTINYIKVEYTGGYVESDFYAEPREYGPLMKAEYPYTQNFDSGFPTTDKPTYYKYGLTAGRENQQWSTWFGSFSWQKAISEPQSVQLRVYQEDPDYDAEQFGNTKMEFFLQDLKQVSFKYYMSEFWIKATISYCEFGTNDWTGAQQIALENYSQRQTVRDYVYVLDEGRPHNAKIRIEIDPATGYPTKDHYDLIMDDFIFE